MTNPIPVISIMLGTYNRYPFLKIAIESIRNNGITMPYEIIVVDGGSNDGTHEYLSQQKDVITIIQHNRGEWRGKKIHRRNYGYYTNFPQKLAHGKYVSMMSDDTLLIPNTIMNGYNHFEKKLQQGEKIGAIAYYFRNYPGDKQYSVYTTYANKIFVNHGMFLKKALEEVGYMDEEKYFFYCADVDLCLKLDEIGYKTIAHDTCVMEHFKHVGESNIVAESKRHKETWENFTKQWGHLGDVNDHGKKIFIDYDDTTHTAWAYRKKMAYYKYLAYRTALGIKRKIFKKPRS